MVVTTEKNGFPTVLSMDTHTVLKGIITGAGIIFTVETGWVCLVEHTKAQGRSPRAYSMAQFEPNISKSKPNITKSESFITIFSFLYRANGVAVF